jgi:hypothetical protein
MSEMLHHGVRVNLPGGTDLAFEFALALHLHFQFGHGFQLACALHLKLALQFAQTFELALEL